MKNISYYKDDTFEFHKKVISSKNNTKKDPLYKSSISSLNTSIKSKFISYETNFNLNTLELLTPHGFIGPNKERLLKLYSYKNSVISQLKQTLTTDEHNRIFNTCQNCTINEVNSLDHVLPKEEFSEFVVNPLNLFPSCTYCNSLKGTAWKDNNKRMFLNLYLDTLPSIQYLFVDIEVHGSDILLTYMVENKDDQIDEELFKIISSHYKRLQLCKRFKNSSYSVVSELDLMIKNYLTKLDLETIKEIIISQCQDEQNAFGFNYWKTILKLTLIYHDDFMKMYSS